MNQDPSTISRAGEVGADGGMFIYTVVQRLPDLENGVVIVSFCSLAECRQEAEEVADAMSAAGLHEGDMVGVLSAFLPNGANLDEQTAEQMRTGNGTFVLRQVMADAQQVGARAVCILPTSESARQFFEKRHHFHRVDLHEPSEEVQAYFWKTVD